MIGGFVVMFQRVITVNTSRAMQKPAGGLSPNLLEKSAERGNMNNQELRARLRASTSPPVVRSDADGSGNFLEKLQRTHTRPGSQTHTSAVPGYGGEPRRRGSCQTSNKTLVLKEILLLLRFSRRSFHVENPADVPSSEVMKSLFIFYRRCDVIYTTVVSLASLSQSETYSEFERVD